MKKNLLFLCLTVTALITFSCQGTGPFTPTSSGNPYEIIVVVDNNVWEEPAGRALYDVLDSNVPGLPQPERAFRIMYTDPKNFDTTLKLIRNIIIVDIQPERYTQASFKTAKDVYAAPQAILSIQAPNQEEFQTFVTENSQAIIDYFTNAEMNRRISLLENNHSDYISTKVASMFDCDIWVPGELESTKEGENFFWAGTNKGTADMNFVIYSYPYRDADTFTKDYFVHKRDSVMKVNIPGSFEGSYMATDARTVTTKPINVQGQYAFEAKGLWKMQGGDFMGGPFISHSRIDEINNRVIVAEIFIYSPDKLKRNLVRFMEASLYTLKTPQQRQPGVSPTIHITPEK